MSRAVGFTGTQHGMNLLQERAVGQLLVDLQATELHHGVCVGADAQAHWVARALGLQIVGHPPVKTAKIDQACLDDCDELRPPLDYLDRNHVIVDETSVLLATPQKMHEELRSGTWATVRYSRAQSSELYVVWSNGGVWHENAPEPERADAGA